MEEKKLDYKISLGYWNSVFAVPSAVVDKYLGKITLTQIKVLLWILRNSDKTINLEEVTKKLNIKEEEFEEAFKYWNELGILSAHESEKAYGKILKICSSASESESNSTLNLPRKLLTCYQRPELSHIAKRIKNSKEIYYMIQEAQVALRRPISSGDSTILIMLHDNEGLPIDVILMLIQYCVSIGRSNIRSIERMGIGWAAAGVDTIDKAEKKIQSLSHNSVLWKKFECIISIEHRAPSSQEEEIILRWFDEWKIDEKLIKHAYDICINSKGKYSIHYMDGIIKRWRSQGISTLEQAKMFVPNKMVSGKKHYSRNEENSSYSIEEYESYSIFDEK